MTSVIQTNGEYKVNAETPDDEISVNGDLIIQAAGRVPDIDDLKLDQGNVERDTKGVRVNEYLQSKTNPRVYAAGDAASTEGKPLTPVSGFESHIVASNILNGNQKTANYPAQPTTVFTVPPLAAVGLTKQEAKKQKKSVKVHHNYTENWYA